MKRILQISAAGAVAIWSVVSAVPAFAQRGCPEGRTASGQCVNAGLAAAIEQSGILFSQPKISYTALPILPSGDMQYRYPYNLIPSMMMPSAAGILPPPPPPNPNPNPGP